MLVSQDFQFFAFALLSPAFLAAGLALAAVPIVIHLLNRRRFRVTQWAAMEFLLAAIKKNRRRLRFESWLLLAVRCAALLLLGLALSRPMGCGNSSMAALGQRTGLNVFIIDNSYSMGFRFPRGQAQTHLDQAKFIAHTLVSRMEAGSEGLVLLTAAAPAQAVIAQPTYDLSAANSAIDSLPQTAAGTDLAGTLQQAITVAQHNAALPNKHLYILTDSTRSALDAPGSADLRTLARQLSQQYSITYFNLGQSRQENLALSNLHSSDSVLTTKFPAQFLIDVRGFNAAASASLQWKMDGRPISVTQSSASPAGVSAMLDNVPLATGGPHVLSVSATPDDPLPIDNVCSHVFTIASQMKVLLVEGDRGAGAMSGSASFLNIALAPTQSPGKQADSYIQPTTISDLQLPGEVLADYRAIVLANVPTLSAAEANALQQYVRSGGTLLIFMGELVNAENYNQMFLSRGLLPGPLQRRMTAPPNSPYHFDFHPNAPLHAILQFLRNQPRSGLETTDISSYWQVKLPANSKAERVLNYQPQDGGRRIKDEKTSTPSPGTPGEGRGEGTSSFILHPSSLSPSDPAITLQSLGEGRVLFFSTTADAQWTTLPAKPVYVPLMHELLRGSIVPNDLWMNLTIGQRLQIPAHIKLTAAPELLNPAGQHISLQLTDAAPPIYQSSPLIQPGVYTLDAGNTTYPIAVNPPSDEADVRTESPSAIRSILGDIPMDIEGDQPPPVVARRDEGRDFGWSAMLLVLAFLGVECFMAMKFGHYRR